MYFPAVTPTLPQVSQESEHLMSAVPLVPLVPFFCVLCCELGRGLYLLASEAFPDNFLLYYPPLKKAKVKAQAQSQHDK